MWEQPKRLYVAEFRTGVIKIGVTGMTGTRRDAYLRRRFGPITRVYYGQPHQCGFWAERQLIQRVRKMACTHRGREWFTGVRFGTVVTLVNQLTRMAHAHKAAKDEREAA